MNAISSVATQATIIPAGLPSAGGSALAATALAASTVSTAATDAALAALTASTGALSGNLLNISA